MSEPTDPREIRHNAGQHDCGLNPVSPSKDGVHVHTIDPSQLPQHDYGANRFGSDLRNMDPQTIRERHLQAVLPRTPYDRDQVRKQRAADACGWHQKCTQEEKRLSDRCLAIINSLEHMEVDKDIALIALEKLCGVDK